MALPADPFEGHEDPDATGMLTTALVHKSLFDAYLKVGFRRPEAAQLVAAFIAASAMAELDPNG